MTEPSPSRTTQPGDPVVLVGLPAALIADLPLADQQAILAALGTRVTLVGWDEEDRAEIQFEDSEGGWHFLFIDRCVVAPIDGLRRFVAPSSGIRSHMPSGTWRS